MRLISSPTSPYASKVCMVAHASAQGVMDAAVNTVMERRRPNDQHSLFWLER